MECACKWHLVTAVSLCRAGPLASPLQIWRGLGDCQTSCQLSGRAGLELRSPGWQFSASHLLHLRLGGCCQHPCSLWGPPWKCLPAGTDHRSLLVLEAEGPGLWPWSRECSFGKLETDSRDRAQGGGWGRNVPSQDRRSVDSEHPQAGQLRGHKTCVVTQTPH